MTERRNQVSGLCTSSEFLNALQKQHWPRYLRITDDSFYVQRWGDIEDMLEFEQQSVNIIPKDWSSDSMLDNSMAQHCVN